MFHNYKIDAEFNADGVIVPGDATNPNIVYDEFTGGDPNMSRGEWLRTEAYWNGYRAYRRTRRAVGVFIGNPHATVPSYEI